MTPIREVWFVVPEGIDEVARVSGGNVFDARVRDGLSALGWDVRMVSVDPDAAAPGLARVPDAALVLIDGLVAGRSPEAIEAAADRLRPLILAHMVSAAFPDADPDVVAGESRALAAAHGVITTSEWTRSQIVEAGLVRPERVFVATPGSDDSPLAVGTATGRALLCIGVLAPHKGQDVLVEALAALGDEHEGWTCTLAGSADAAPAYARRVADRAAAAGLGDRLRMPGVVVGAALEAAYRSTDLVVAPSRVESYGIGVADALRRGIPVLASDVGGIPEAVAHSRGAILVPPGDAEALEDTLRRWMTDPALRARLTAQARRDSGRMPPWARTASRVSAALQEVR